MELDKELINKIKITPLLDTLQLENISDSEYFGTYYKNRLSNSRLSLLKNKGAKVFFEGLKQEFNPSFQFGNKIF